MEQAIQLTDPEHPLAREAAEAAARLLIHHWEHRASQEQHDKENPMGGIIGRGQLNMHAVPKTTDDEDGVMVESKAKEDEKPSEEGKASEEAPADIES